MVNSKNGIKKEINWDEAILHIIIATLVVLIFILSFVPTAAEKREDILLEKVEALERELIYAREHKDAWIKSFGRFYLYAEDWPMREEAAEKAILYSFYEFEDPNKEWSMQEKRMWVGKTLVTFVDQKIFHFESFRFQDPDLGF